MRDYAELILDLRRHHCDAKEDDTQEVCEECAYDVIVADKSKFNGITDVCTCGLMHRAADAIEELLAKDTNVPNKWISVEERLPEDGKDVLCWYEYYHWNKEKMLPEYGIGYCINGHWGGEVSNGRDCKVLYWMPLPEPPKGVE